MHRKIDKLLTTPRAAKNSSLTELNVLLIMLQVLRKIESLEAFNGVSFCPAILGEPPFVSFKGDTTVTIRT